MHLITHCVAEVIIQMHILPMLRVNIGPGFALFKQILLGYIYSLGRLVEVNVSSQIKTLLRIYVLFGLGCFFYIQ